MKKKIYCFLYLFIVPLFSLLAADGDHGGSHSMTHQMMHLSLQIGTVIFAGYIGLKIAKKLHIPGILGELTAGIIIGPFLLGQLPLPGFSEGLFPLIAGGFPVSPELFGFATVASIVLLFLTGLQTDLSLFLRYALRGTFVGLGGVAVSLLTGSFIGILVLGGSGFDPRSLFLGVIAVATSVDITARILNDRRKMTSPEGVTILAASVIEDVLGITFLAVLIGIDSVEAIATIPWDAFLSIGGRAIFVWLSFTTLGIVFSHQIGRILKIESNRSQIAVLALGLALIVAGLFETAGLAMIIGAYVVGLSLSNTDIAYVIQENIEPVHHFFDPIFFTVIGMLINLQVLLSVDVLLYGLIFGVLAIITKMIGCGLPALAVGFTPMGAYRISLGMMPRGEVALIIAGIGLSSGLLNDTLFGIAILMTLITTVIAPPLLNWSLKSKLPGTRVTLETQEQVSTDFEFGSRSLIEFLLQDLLTTMQNEGFFIHTTELDQRIYHMRRDTVYISLLVTPTTMSFSSKQEDVTFINNLMYEGTLELQSKVDQLRTLSKPIDMRAELVDQNSRNFVNWYRYLEVETITLNLHSGTKEDAIKELLDLLVKAGKISDPKIVLEAIMNREQSMSTGLKNGIAIPHGRSEGAKELCVAIGLSPQGIDFSCLDGKLARAIFLLVSPERDPGPHLQILSGIAGVLKSEEAVNELVLRGTRSDLISYMVKNSRTNK